MNGEKHKALMLTSVGQTSEIKVFGWGIVTCNVTLLVVGGGGGGGYYNGGLDIHLGGWPGGGGGSGYLEYRSLQVAAGTRLLAQVGDKGQNSNVTSPNSSELSVTAQAGENNQGWVGGAGYSGGGGSGGGRNYGGDGGSNGGDGKGGYWSGGAGTGEDVSLYLFSAWTLGPGAGSKHRDYIAGGGGGILVNGEGPQDPDHSLGAGYGGGGPSNALGHPGVILIETN